MLPTLRRQGDWGEEYESIGPKQTAYFSFTRLQARSRATLWRPGTAQIAIVPEGTGTLCCGGKRYGLEKGQEWFFPYAMEETWVEPELGQTLSLILAKPTGAKQPE